MREPIGKQKEKAGVSWKKLIWSRFTQEEMEGKRGDTYLYGKGGPLGG